ncbi:unnamed protein product, partial [Didymodactylos carnosus]
MTELNQEQQQLNNNNKNNNVDIQPPPPSYPSVVYKIDDIYSRHGYDGPPPSYIEHYPYAEQHSNYPGPPDSQISGSTTNVITLLFLLLLFNCC